MQFIFDKNKKTIEWKQRNDRKSGSPARRAAAIITAPARVFSQIGARISYTYDKTSDWIKALGAVIVLAAAVATIVNESGALRMLKVSGKGKETSAVEAAGSLGSAQRASAALVLDAVKTDLGDAKGFLQEGLEEKTKELRKEYMEILDAGKGASFEPESEAEKKLWEEVRAQRKKELSEDPFLLLVNKWHYLPEDYTADPVYLPNGQMIDSECYDELVEMLEDCEEAGGNPIVCSGYRPHDKQVYLYSEQINRWLYAGYGQEDAEALAATAVAIPGTSEHELGLAADIYSSENMSLDESQIYTFTQQWLMENCWRYGFILRYPQDKSDITGIIFEPWHYRYVGSDHAKKIQDAGICLEEYLEEAEHPQEEEETGESSESNENENYNEAGDYYNTYYY